MFIKLSYEQEFVDLIFHLKSKYGEEIFEVEGIGSSNLDLPQFAKQFFNTGKNNKSVADKSIDSNANISDNPSVINFTVEATKPYFKLNSMYKLWKDCKKTFSRKIANDLIESAIIGDLYINDSTNLLQPYCYNFSTLDLANIGLPAVNKIQSVAPKHLFSFFNQLGNFIVIASNNTLGATGIADLLVTVSIYMDRVLKNKKDSGFSFASEEDCWTYLRESITSFIYIVNQNFRSNQSAFTNISIYDKHFLSEMLDNYKLLIDGELYEAKMEIVQKIQELYLDCFNDTLDRTPCTFPVTTSCHSIDSEYNVLDQEFLHMIASKNQKYGFINMYSGSTSTLSSCCRLRSDKSNEYFNSIGGSSSKIGSLGVCTINLPRLAFKFKNSEEEFFNNLKIMVRNAQRINVAKRNILRKRIENDNLPLYKYGYMTLETQYMTVGCNGIYECVTEMGYDILTKEGVDFQLKIIDTINNENDAISKQYKHPTNCEQIPAESVAIKLASKDKIFGYNHKYALYSNQFIPLVNNANMLDRIHLQGIFDKHFSGGSILHLNVGSRIENIESLKLLMTTAIKNGVIYFAINYVLTQCSNGHMGVDSPSCEVCSCGAPIVGRFSRVVGFLTSIHNWHYIRRNEDFPNRKFYNGIQV